MAHVARIVNIIIISTDSRSKMPE